MAQANSVEQSGVGSARRTNHGPGQEVPLGVVVGVWNALRGDGNWRVAAERDGDGARHWRHVKELGMYIVVSRKLCSPH